MPIYEYRCVSCEHVYDVIQTLSEAPHTQCPECGKKVEKVVSGPALQFKGSGFYITDYAKKGKGEASKGGGGKEKAAKPAEKKPKKGD